MTETFAQKLARIIARDMPGHVIAETSVFYSPPVPPHDNVDLIVQVRPAHSDQETKAVVISHGRVTSAQG